MLKNILFGTAFIFMLALCLYIIFHKDINHSQGRVWVIEDEIEINGEVVK